VHVIEHTPAWRDRLQQGMQRAAAHKSASTNFRSLEAMVATYLRVDVPLLLDPATYGSYVLYTDTDVLFLRDLHLNDFGLNGRGSKPPPAYVVGTEASPTRIPNYPNAGNAGVMLLHLPAMRATRDGFVAFAFGEEAVAAGFHFGNFGPADQGAYNKYYEKQFDVIDHAPFNWKPYWPYSDNAAILHFHGPKPSAYRRYLRDGKASDPLMTPLLHRCAADCRRWLDAYSSLEAAHSMVLA